MGSAALARNSQMQIAERGLIARHGKRSVRSAVAVSGLASAVSAALARPVALAEAEARAGDPERALALLDEALATCDCGRATSTVSR